MSKSNPSMSNDLEKSAHLHLIHYLVLIFSTSLTLFAWQYTLHQSSEKSLIQFKRENDHIIELVKERIQKYHDFLWTSRAYIQRAEVPLTDERWQSYINAIKLTEKYPGINGIGVIFNITSNSKNMFIKKHQHFRPTYNIYPEHDKSECWPITYLSPLKGNEKAIGLDMAHEKNRYEAAIKARDTGLPQITGPITLVQDENKTPGFLFYVPVYNSNNLKDKAQRKENFVCLAYAPFIFKNLVKGVLSKETRNINITISDENTVLYDENIKEEPNYDPHPRHHKDTNISLYGRIWQFNINSGLTFNEKETSNQSYTILVCGLIIDATLLILFLSLTRSNRKSIVYAKKMNEDLIQSEIRLKNANEELTQFNYRTSHDLVAPLRTIDGYVYLAKDDIEENDLESACKYFDKIQIQSERLSSLIEDLLNLCRADNTSTTHEIIDFEKTIEEIKEKLSGINQFKKVDVKYSFDLKQKPKSDYTRIRQILENLISNGIKYSDSKKSNPFVDIKIISDEQEIKIIVSDNGIGIPKEYHQKIFEMFTKFNNDEFGSGLGTYLVKKHTEALKGTIEFESTSDGSSFIIKIPQVR